MIFGYVLKLIHLEETKLKSKKYWSYKERLAASLNVLDV